MQTSSLSRPSARILFKKSNSQRIANIHEIVYLEADNNYTYVYLKDGSVYRKNRTLKIFEERLGNTLFCRCHKSYLVNTSYMSAIKSNKESSIILLKTGKNLPVSRRKISKLRCFLKLNDQTTDN